MIKLLLALILTITQAQAVVNFKTKLSNGQTLEKNTQGFTIDRNGHSLTNTNGQIAFALRTNGSLAFSNNKLQLTNDVASPGNTYYYGTNGSGTKGFYTLSAGSGTVTNVSNGDRFSAVANKTTTPSITFLSQGSAAWATKISDEVGTGRMVFNGSPTFSTPTLGAASATTINSTTIPSSKTLVVTTDKLSVLAATTSSELAGVLSDEVGTGKFLLNGTPLMSSATLNKTTTINGNTLSIPALTQGDLVFSKVASSMTRLGKGTNHYVLKTNGNTLAWEAGGGTVTQVKNGDVFHTVANQTTTPAISLASQSSATWAGVFTDEVGTGKFLLNGTPLMSSATLNKTTTINGSTFSLPAATQGDILYSKVAAAYRPLAKGTNHYALKVNGNTLAYESVPSPGNNLSYFAATTSAQLAGVISDEVGTGRMVFNGSPTFLTPTLGSATATKVIASGTVNGVDLGVSNGAFFTAINNIGNGNSLKSINCSKSNTFQLTLNATTLNPFKCTTKPRGVTTVRFIVKQAKIPGTQTMTFNGDFWFPGGTAPVFSTTNGATDVVSCLFQGTLNGHPMCDISKDFR